MGFPGDTHSKEPVCQAGDARDLGSITGLGRSPGGGKATHSSISARKIPWTEEPGRLQSMGCQEQTQLKWLSTYMVSFMFLTPDHIASPLTWYWDQDTKIIGKFSYNYHPYYFKSASLKYSLHLLIIQKAAMLTMIPPTSRL